MDTKDLYEFRETSPAAQVTAEILRERVRQNLKHPGRTLDTGEFSEAEKLVVLMEEVGELAHELTYDSDHDDDKVYAELTQVAALAFAWMESYHV